MVVATEIYCLGSGGDKSKIKAFSWLIPSDGCEEQAALALPPWQV